MSNFYDVLVVGGGPAGCITALRLARLGFRVSIAEAQMMPRPHIGESITLPVHHQLLHLALEGILDRSGRQDFYTSEERWTTSAVVAKAAAPGTATINRARFDAALLERCRIEGVNVIVGQRVRSLKRSGSHGWEAMIETALPLHARLVVDATGRRGILPKSREMTGARTIALFAYWEGDGLPVVPRISASKAGWAWGAPVTGIGYNITLFVDRRAIVQSGGDARRAYVQGAIDAEMIGSAAIPKCWPKVIACDATAWFDKACVGRDFIKVGEAAQCLDPLASMGIQKAIQTAIWASIVINTSLRRPASQTAAQSFYQQRIAASAATHAAAVTEIYATSAFRDLPFWTRRAAYVRPPMEEGPAFAHVQIPSPSSFISRGPAPVIDHPCLCGDFVETREAVLVGKSREPVAFLGELAIADVINKVGQGCEFADLQAWMAARAELSTTDRFAAWLITNGVIRAG